MDSKPFDIFGLHDGSVLTGDYSTYAAEIGNVIWAWNHLHGALCDNFWCLLDIDNPIYARSIWHSIKSDKGQRDMLRALTLAHKEDRPYGPLTFKMRQFHHALIEIIWMCNEIGQISAFRNDATHTLWTKELELIVDYDNYTLPKAIPDAERGNLRGKRVQGKDAAFLFRALANHSFNLAQYCRFIDGWLWMIDDSATFPERPDRPQILRDHHPKQTHAPPDPK